MQTFSTQMRLVFMYAFLSLAVVAILWAALPGSRVFLQSLFLGMIGSTINGAVLFAKTWRVGQAAVDPRIRARGTGMLQRFLIASMAIYCTIAFPQYFVLSGVLIGLFLIQLLSVVTFLIRSF
ncbi:ATP synthase subunit I [Brevibacillus humidisoli]|uniref:ATP synthase subunit I n=1 Tax=Brevibacillus humidisoli TaxID=2895522 RepID=UPI001E2C5073|nr:ATP synthase subunit I [Brevibacillus humidisoli]UFJ40169.1 ATP synthase subunit I [Brevibacillus humidisoli]